MMNNKGKFKITWFENGIQKSYIVNGGNNAQRLWEKMISKDWHPTDKRKFNINETKIERVSLNLY